MICDSSIDFDLFTATPFEMFEGIQAISIHNDIKLLENHGLPSIFDEDIISDMPFLESEKFEIRQHDCMWSGRCKTDMEKNKVTTAKVSQHSFHHHHHSHSCTDDQMLSTSPIQTQKIVAPHDVTNNIFVPQQQQTQQNSKQTFVTVKTPAFVKSSSSAISKDLKTTVSSMQNIAPGTSLLINSRFNQQKKHHGSNLSDKSSNNSSSIPVISTSDFLRQREQPSQTAPAPNFFQIRPESPLSLDDDPPETKHSVDLSACMVGSNNISLESSFAMTNTSSHHDFEKSLRIKTLCEQLEDPTVQISPAVNEETPVASADDDDFELCLDVIKGHIEVNDDDLLDEDKSDVDSDSSDTYHTKSHSPSSGYGSQSPEYNEYNSPHSDHSYTRSKSGGLSGLGVETPSDSDEEIDVVSVGDKKLPTNPSDKDRRVLQTKVANRFTSRMVTTSNGLRTIPPKRSKDTNSSGSSNSSMVGSTRHLYSNSNSTSPSTGTTHPYAGLKKPIYNAMASVNGHHHHHHLSSGSQSRKRHSLATSSSSSSYKDDYSPSSKRSRGKKSRPSTGSRRHNNHSNNNSINSSVNFDQDEAETIEKRNLHNNMERQRRIGLKNLFEALKRQIPTIKDKDRAPKVNILREAAKLCDQLTRDENQLQSAKQQLQNQLQRRQSQLRMLKQQLQQQQQQQLI